MNVTEEIQNTFRTIVPEVNLNTFNMDRPIRDQVDMDSLDVFNFITKIHKQTGVSIPDSKIPELHTLNEIIKFVSVHKS